MTGAEFALDEPFVIKMTLSSILSLIHSPLRLHKSDQTGMVPTFCEAALLGIFVGNTHLL